MTNRIVEYVIVYYDKKPCVNAWWCDSGEDIGDFESVDAMKKYVNYLYGKQYHIIFTRLYEEG